jgi:hypothetical protein
VVRDKKANLRIRDQVQIAVEVLGVSGVADDPVSVTGFFIEARRHGIHVGMIFELTRMHAPLDSSQVLETASVVTFDSFRAHQPFEYPCKSGRARSLLEQAPSSSSPSSKSITRRRAAISLRKRLMSISFSHKTSYAFLTEAIPRVSLVAVRLARAVACNLITTAVGWLFCALLSVALHRHDLWFRKLSTA